MPMSWFITGCSTGFGKLLAQKLLDQGYNVVATARNVDQLADLKAPDEQKMIRAPLDVTRGAQITEAAQTAFERFGHIDVLVNNAGYGYFSTFEDGDVDEIRRMFETNVTGLIRATQAFLPSMRERRSGTIVNLSSIAGRVAFCRAAFYNASKFAVEALSEALHHETRTFGIRVIVIEPGAYDTDFAPRSAVRSPMLADPEAPYAHLADKWSDASARMMPEKQDPMEVVDGIIEAVLADKPFMRIPFGRDAEALVTERESMSDADFIRAMSQRYEAS